MPLRTPPRTNPGDPPYTALPMGEHPPVPVLLLSDPGVEAVVQGLLQSSPLGVRLWQVDNLNDAMIAASNHPPALAIIDMALCEALEREFLDHLLQTHRGIQVMLLEADGGESCPSHPRLTRLRPQALLPAVAQWLAARAGIQETGT